MINVTFTVRVRPEKREEFLQVMRSLRGDRENDRVSPGAPVLYKDVDDEARFSLTYEWETPQRLEAYVRAENFRVLLGAVKVLCDTSEVRYSQDLENWPNSHRA